MEVRRNSQNLGYGGNQKAGYRRAIELGLDIIVLLHGDGQYAPELLPDIVAPLERNESDAVFGSRMMIKGAAREGGMPLYKLRGEPHPHPLRERRSWHGAQRVPLRLPRLQRRRPQAPRHRELLGRLRLRHRDHHRPGRRGHGDQEIPIPTYYGDEICYVNGLRYARDVTQDVLRYRAQKAGLGRAHGAAAMTDYALKESLDSSHQAILEWMARPPARVLDLGCSSGEMSTRLRALGHHVVGVDVVAHPGVEDRTDEFFAATWTTACHQRLEGPFDVILCADVLEHVRHPEALMAELHELLAPRGRLIASVPNFAHWYPRARTAARAVRLRPAGHPRRGPRALLHPSQLPGHVRSDRLERRRGTARRACRSSSSPEAGQPELPPGSSGAPAPSGRPCSPTSCSTCWSRPGPEQLARHHVALAVEPAEQDGDGPGVVAEAVTGPGQEAQLGAARAARRTGGRRPPGRTGRPRRGAPSSGRGARRRAASSGRKRRNSRAHASNEAGKAGMPDGARAPERARGTGGAARPSRRSRPVHPAWPRPARGRPRPRRRRPANRRCSCPPARPRPARPRPPGGRWRRAGRRSSPGPRSRRWTGRSPGR